MSPKTAVDDPLGRFLCCALADDPAWHRREIGHLWAAVGDDAAWAFAQEHEAEGNCAMALERAMGGSVPARWRSEQAAIAARIGLYMDEIDRVSAALKAAGIPMIALKNSGIARGIFGNYGSCPMGDVDVLVPPASFRQAHDIMKSLGFVIGDRSPFEIADIEEAEKHGGAEYTLPLRDGSVLWFELQWRAVAGRWIRPDQEPPVSDLIAKSVPMAGTDARLLSPEHNLLQVCLHTAKHSYVRAPGIRLHTDVDRIVRHCQLDWDGFMTEVERLQVRTAVFLSLQIPARLLRTPIPGFVLKRLRPRKWKERALLNSIERAGYFHPRVKKWNKAGYIIFNLMLYDTLGGVWRAIFPDSAWMRKRYNFAHGWMLPWWHARRIVELIFKRAQT